MKKVFKSSLVLALSINLATVSTLQAEVVSLEEDAQNGICPSKEISYLNNLSTHTLMEGEGAIDYSWDSDKYSFAPNADGTVKITYNSEEKLSVKIDNICNGSEIYRLAGSRALASGTTEFRVLADQEVHIGLWDWDNGPYLYDLDIEFTPDDDQGGGDNNDTTPTTGQTIYEDAQNSNTDGWENIFTYPGSVTNIASEGNRVIKLTGPSSINSRAAYRLKLDEGSNWANSEQFIAKWDMQTSSKYELFFYAKSDDDASIDNYIGYVNELPELEGYSFDTSTGYWSIGENVLHGWGRYVYNLISDDTSAQLTTFTKDLKASALNTLGINLTSIEYMHVNVYTDASSSLLLDNISLQASTDTPTNTPPVAIAQSLTVDENSSKTFTLTATDADNDALTFEISLDVSNGFLSGSAPNLTYLPDAGFVGSDSFTFTVSDGNASSTATVDINVVAVTPDNTPPVAIAQSVEVDKNASIAFTLTATDADNNALSYTIDSNASNGTLSGTPPNLTYTPDVGFVGSDSFTFLVSDGNSGNSTATVSITVNDVQNGVEITENEALSEHFLGMPIDISRDTTIINGTITADWDMDRYSFDANNLGEISITLKDSAGNDMPFFVIRNYTEIVTANSSGVYNLGSEFSVITIMIIAENSTTSTYTLTIEAPDTTPPIITLLGDTTVNLTVGDSYTDEGATASDTKDGDISAAITTVNLVDTATAGTYTITYNVSDTAENAATEVSRTVIVSQAPDAYANWIIAKNNLVRDISESFNGNSVKVLVEPGKQIGEDDTSNSTDAVYGLINGAQTGALLKINPNYASGTKMVVRVYDASGNTLATSSELTYTGSTMNFGDLTF